ncbi:His-Xaa-Ser system protein HxsD [Marinobacter halodurans]|uniref:His-Xaa-Ser system protein HxsD n=1 Tax=Marinobacter halodurans TaxID=2528979 RepID=A0ABY1ZFW1_9GAMM|nr:His-Xaa-Ser system protein HxsD [Marinobacter halodurans]TBW49536.1 His-Xaa-Ser system protein HxsD [Marinobacter halodurans]
MRYLDKERYSEWVVRQALYWLTPTTRWRLDETENQWAVALDDDSYSAQAELDRLLNDFLLRERIGRRTETTRSAIADAVIRSIQQRLSES